MISKSSFCRFLSPFQQFLIDHLKSNILGRQHFQDGFALFLRLNV
jgi:hypothetical protein